jgi:hypothetical protein
MEIEKNLERLRKGCVGTCADPEARQRFVEAVVWKRDAGCYKMGMGRDFPRTQREV